MDSIFINDMMKKLFLFAIAFQLFCIEGIHAKEIELSVKTRSGYNLAGTLVVPNQQSKKLLVIMLTPPNDGDRDQQGVDKAFADSLEANGIASFRYDNRVFSDSIKHEATLITTSYLDTAEDGIDMMNQLRAMPVLAGYRMGFYGISEGGGASMVAASKIDCSFCVPIAFPTADGSWFKFQQFTSPLWENTLDNSDALIMETGIRLIDLYAKRTSLEDFKAYYKNKYDSGKMSEKDYKGIDRGIEAWKFNALKHEQDVINCTLDKFAETLNCPMLYVGCKYDEKLNAMHELAFFEKLMFKHNKTNFKTAVVDCNHMLMSKDEDIIYRTHLSEGEQVAKRDKMPEMISVVVNFLKEL